MLRPQKGNSRVSFNGTIFNFGQRCHSMVISTCGFYSCRTQTKQLFYSLMLRKMFNMNLNPVSTVVCLPKIPLFEKIANFPFAHYGL